MELNLDHTAITEQSKWLAKADPERAGKPFRYDQIAAIPDPTAPADCLVLADEIDALVRSMAREPGNYGSFMIVASKEELERASELLGHDALGRDLPHRGKDSARDFLGQTISYGQAIRDLMERSTKLRIRALGPRPYPVLVCERCRQATGWLNGGTAGVCDACLRSDIVAINQMDLPEAVMGGAKEIDDMFSRILNKGLNATTFSESEYGQAPSRLTRWFRSGRYDEQVALNWGHVVHGPVICGPDTPEDGFSLWLPGRYERVSANNAETLIGFYVERYRWQRDHWVASPNTGRWEDRAERDDQPPHFVFPRVFPATLPVEALEAAWDDFTALCWQDAADRWDAECDRRGIKRAERDTQQAIAGVNRDEVLAGKGAIKALDEYARRR